MIAARMTLSLLAAALAVVFALAGGPLAASAAAAPEWRLEQPEPPPPPSGVQDSEVCQGEPTSCHRTPVGLGRIGDIEFFKPNLGLLITAGNGSTVPPGIWVYNGTGWHELANVCGATDGRIAWAGPEEFWTVSDGRPGQAANGEGDLPPLEDDTLCHFTYNEASEKLEVVGSYAAPAFQASSYQPMHAAACVNPNDCWFAGGPLPEPEPGAFHLHWNGSSLEAEPNTAVQAVQDMRIFEDRLYESIALPLEESAGLAESPTEILHPSILQEIAPEGSTHTFVPQHPKSAEAQFLPQYASHAGVESFPAALGFLHLSADEDSLWAAAGPLETPPEGSAPAELTVLRDSGGTWTQVLGPEETGEGEKSESLKVDPPSLEKEAVSALAAEPESASAWLALDTQQDLKSPNATRLAKVVNVTAEGSLSEEQLPSETERAEGIGAKGAAYRIVCPARNDCWMATTQGWLFHLSEEGSRTLAPETDPAFNGELITYRPRDQGLPQELSDALVDESVQEEAPPASAALTKLTLPNSFATTSVPLLSDVHTRLLHDSTLELSFHLAVKARVRLIAKRHASVVASTPTRTLKAGKRSLQLRLNPRRWPTRLSLQTHALAPLPTVSSLSSGVETISTSLAFPKALGISGWGPSL
jgi:hypothetical protein